MRRQSLVLVLLLAAACSSGGTTSTDPGSTDPGSTDPGSTDPGPTDPASTDPGPVDALEGLWNVQLIAGAPTVVGSEPTLEITKVEITGTTGCNRFGGMIAFVDGTMSISDMSWTEIGCEPSLMDQESTMLSILSQADAYEINDELLMISGRAGTLEATPADGSSR